MQPHDPLEPAPTGIDYLNHIAPAGPPERKISTKAKIAIAVFGLIGVLSISIIVAMAGQTESSPAPLRLVARLQKLQKISGDYHRKLRTSALQDTNSSLSAVLTTANQSITTPLQSYGIDISKQKEALATLDPSTKLVETLDEAFLNYRLDETYIREMSYQLEETVIIMKSLYKKTSYKTMRDYLEKTITDFENLHKRFIEMGPAEDPLTTVK